MLCPVGAFLWTDWGSYYVTFDLEAPKWVFVSGRLSLGILNKTSFCIKIDMHSRLLANLYEYSVTMETLSSRCNLLWSRFGLNPEFEFYKAGLVLTNTSFNSNLQIKTYESPFLQDRNKDKNITETQSDLTFLWSWLDIKQASNKQQVFCRQYK